MFISGAEVLSPLKHLVFIAKDFLPNKQKSSRDIFVCS